MSESEFEKQFPKPKEDDETTIVDYTVELGFWLIKREGWLAALRWQASIDSGRNRDKLLYKEITVNE